MMKQLENYEEVSPLIRKYFKPNMITNHFMSEDEYRSLILNKNLFYHEFGNGILFLKKKEDINILTYQLINLDDNLNLEVPENTVLEIVKRPADKNLYDIETFWENNGFEKILERDRMFIDKNKFSNNVIAIENFRIDFCGLDEATEIMKIIKDNFSMYTGCIPTSEELENELKNNLIYGAFNDENKLVGVLHFGKKKGYTEIRHLAVSEEARRSGIGSKLVQKYHNDTSEFQKRLWVSRSNEKAKKIYAKHGYACDGWTSVVLKKKINESY